MHDAFLQQTVAQIVRDNYRTAAVFQKNGINYCCGGAVPLAEACSLKNIPAEQMIAQLEKASQTVSVPSNLQYNNWKLDFLVDYIVHVHHAYLKETLPKLEMALIGFVNSHKKKLPFLEDVLLEFNRLATLLQRQMQQEEEVVFPYIKRVEAAYSHKESYGGLLVKTLRKPLQQPDLQALSRSLTNLRQLTNDYRFNDESCTNHRVIFQQLQELDNDLVQHKHLENNILLPRASDTEQSLLQNANMR